jgi:hypothetical protein
MQKNDTVIAVFDDHQSAETAVKKLASAGFDMKSLSSIRGRSESRRFPDDGARLRGRKGPRKGHPGHPVSATA